MADHLDDVFGDTDMIEAPVEVFTDVSEEVVQPVEEPAPETPQEPEQVAAEPVSAQEEANARVVPLAVVLDERDKKRDAEARAQRAEEERDRYKQQWESTQQRQQQRMPDALDDPEGFNAYQDQRIHQAVTAQRFQMSELMAKQTHGEETVQKASEWALERSQTDPTFAQAYHQQAHPIDWIVQQHKRDALLSDIGDNVDDWFTREAVKRGYHPASVAAPAPAVAVPQQATPPAKVPRSLATQGSGPSDIRQVATGPTAAVDALFS